MGELDANIAIPYEDGYCDSERELIFEVLGEEMYPARWEKCREIYQRENINAQIRTYKGLGHEHPDSVKNDILYFFENYSNKPSS